MWKCGTGGVQERDELDSRLADVSVYYDNYYAMTKLNYCSTLIFNKIQNGMLSCETRLDLVIHKSLFVLNKYDTLRKDCDKFVI